MTAGDRDAREIRELAPDKTRLAHRAMLELRPDHSDPEAFAALVDETLRPGGYRLVGVFVRGARDAVAVAGFRVSHSLAWGRHLYLDDLSTLPQARRQGHAAALLAWLEAEARRLGCAQLHLDSGTGPQRFAAHRVYHAHGLAIHSHHFARAV
jgi:GNAT superfamily N-acetyltransferase